MAPIQETPVIEEVEMPNEQEEELEQEHEEQEEESGRVETNSQAQALWDLLNNQATAKSTLRTIASNLGLTVQEVKTESGQRAIKDVIKLALGDDLAFLSDKLGPFGDAIENLINQRTSELESKLEQRQREREAERFTAQVQDSMKLLDRETKGEFTALLPTINKLMEEMPIGKQSPENYLRRLLGVAKSEAAARVKTPTKEQVENARRESEKTSLKGQSNSERVLNGSSKNPSYREAIEAAAKGIVLK
jgi:hypothetical protein